MFPGSVMNGRPQVVNRISVNGTPQRAMTAAANRQNSLFPQTSNADWAFQNRMLNQLAENQIDQRQLRNAGQRQALYAPYSAELQLEQVLRPQRESIAADDRRDALNRQHEMTLQEALFGQQGTMGMLQSRAEQEIAQRRAEHEMALQDRQFAHDRQMDLPGRQLQQAQADLGFRQQAHDDEMRLRQQQMLFDREANQAKMDLARDPMRMVYEGVGERWPDVATGMSMLSQPTQASPALDPVLRDRTLTPEQKLSVAIGQGATQQDVAAIQQAIGRGPILDQVRSMKPTGLRSLLMSESELQDAWNQYNRVREMAGLPPDPNPMQFRGMPGSTMGG